MPVLFSKHKNKIPKPCDEYKRIQETLDENIEQKKSIIDSARNLTKKLTDTLPPPVRKIRAG
jgi:hypothetical protein